MSWSNVHLLELGAEVKRREAERRASAHRVARSPATGAPAARTRRWRTELGRVLMRLGARLADLEAHEHGRAPEYSPR